MRVLIPSAGAREHALAWAARRNGHQVFTDEKANPGLERLAAVVKGMNRDDSRSILQTAVREKIDLTIIGGESRLAEGIVDMFEAAGLPIVGPTQKVAQLETSKLFCTSIMRDAGVGVPHTERLTKKDMAEMLPHLPVVLKYDGPALGKGAKVIRRPQQLPGAVEELLKYKGRFLIQEFIEGQEASFFIGTDGTNAVFLGTAQDYKEIYPGGPMTGGMGGFAPNPIITPELHGRIMDEVVFPTIRTMSKKKMPFRGILYFQLMVRPDGRIFLIEINVRFGAPEAELLVPLYRGDLIEVLASTVKGRKLDSSGFQIDPNQKTVGVVLAAAGYPGDYQKDDVITGLDQLSGLEQVFHGGTKLEGGLLKTNGGRVLTIVGKEADYAFARSRAYLAASQVQFAGKQFRNDIALPEHLAVVA